MPLVVSSQTANFNRAEGFDATDDAKKAVEDGTMAATVAQQPELMGKTAVEIAITIMEGKSVEKSIPVEVTLIKK
jgi:ribose transport system substrate-binding protein